MADEITNAEDIIDSRDVIERIEELEDMAEDGDLDEDGTDELKALQALAKEAANYAPDWEHGEALIRESYFVEYAEQLAEDIGAINRDAPWPQSHIDWEAAARELRIDYTDVDFDGVTYLIR